MALAEDKSVKVMQDLGARLLESSPGLAEKVAAAGKTQPRPGGVGRDERDIAIAELQKQLSEEKTKNISLEDEYKCRMGSFVQRETQTRNKIESLERRLNEGTDHDEHLTRMHAIGTLHRDVQSGLASISSKTQKILQDQEKDLMRAFRSKLQEFSRELEQQRSKRGENCVDMQARHQKVVADLHEAQELAQTFDKKKRQLQAENAKLSEQLRSGDDNGQSLLEDLRGYRKEAAQLKAKAKEQALLGAPGSMAAKKNRSNLEPEVPSKKKREIDPQRLAETQNKQYEREVRARENMQKLKRQVEAERRLTRSLRHRQNEMMQQRTELEVLLQQCVEDVQAEIRSYEMKREDMKSGGADPAATHSGSPEDLRGDLDQERVMELLYSQQRVVELLAARTFATPLPPPLRTQTPPAEDDFSWLSDIIPPGS